MQELIGKLRLQYPNLKYKSAPQFSWSPETGEIFYKKGVDDETSQWSLLHETGHALLGHKTYTTDFELLRLEVEAWQKARSVGQELDITIDEDHIQDCLDTYRDWLHKRSICPNCSTQSLQQGESTNYRCHNCHTTWKVSKNRFCRAYRSTQGVKQKAPAI